MEDQGPGEARAAELMHEAWLVLRAERPDSPAVRWLCPVDELVADVDSVPLPQMAGLTETAHLELALAR